MASTVLSGASNPSYTNNTGQNVRIVINYMNGNSSNEITMNWAGVSVTETNVEGVGKNIACASVFYGDYFWFNFGRWSWWRSYYKNLLNPRSSITTQNVAVRMPVADTEYVNKRRFRQWLFDPAQNFQAGFSFSVALPLELFLAPGQTFSAICGVYNIVVIPENG